MRVESRYNSKCESSRKLGELESRRYVYLCVKCAHKNARTLVSVGSRKELHTEETQKQLEKQQLTTRSSAVADRWREVRAS